MWGSVSRSEGEKGRQEMPTRLNKRLLHRLYDDERREWEANEATCFICCQLGGGCQDGDSEALKARCSISRSHLVFCSGSFSLLFFLRSLLSLRHLSPALLALSLGAWSLFVTWPAWLGPDPVAFRQRKVLADARRAVDSPRDLAGSEKSNDWTRQSPGVENVACEVVASAKSGENGAASKFWEGLL